MPADISTLLVFIASPSDLKDEREALRRLETSLNIKFAPAELAVRFSGWEDLSPGFGRAQGQINPLVERCDIFIGMLRRRWGTPTGKTESGFLEEFRIAAQRRQDSGTEPVVALFFAAISPDEIDDAGPNLSKVLEFRTQIEEQHVALYGTFTSPDDLTKQVEDLLVRHLLQRLIAKRAVSTEDGAAHEAPDGGHLPEASDVTQGNADSATNPLGDAGKQLATTLGDFLALVQGQHSDGRIDSDRLELLSAAVSRDDRPLGAHLINRLYRRRKDLALTVPEHARWVYTLMDDIGSHLDPANRVIPGWALITREDLDLPDLLLGFSKKEDSAAIGHVKK